MKSALQTLAATALLLTLSACHRAPTLNDLAHTYVSLEAQLGERDRDSLDFNISTDPAILQQQHNPQPLAALRQSAEELFNQSFAIHTTNPEEEARRAFLLEQTNALRTRIDELRGTNLDFDHESMNRFSVAALSDTEANQRQQTRAQISTLLNNPHDLPAAYAHFETQFIVPTNRVPAVMLAAIQQCRTITLQHIQLPTNEHVDLELTGHKPWAAFSHYLGNAHSTIQLNMDYPYTLDALLTLACHEGYPGHHVFNTLRDQSLAQAQHREEFTVQPTFSPQSFISEAAATYAPTLALTQEARLHIERDILAPLAGLNHPNLELALQIEPLIDSLHTASPAIARDYLDGNLEFVRAADALRRETLMQHPEPTLLYLNEFRSYMLTYTLGADRMKAFIEANNATPETRWTRYKSLMTTPTLSLPQAP